MNERVGDLKSKKWPQNEPEGINAVSAGEFRKETNLLSGD